MEALSTTVWSLGQALPSNRSTWIKSVPCWYSSRTVTCLEHFKTLSTKRDGCRGNKNGALLLSDHNEETNRRFKSTPHKRQGVSQFWCVVKFEWGISHLAAYHSCATNLNPAQDTLTESFWVLQAQVRSDFISPGRWFSERCDNIFKCGKEKKKKT